MAKKFYDIFPPESQKEILFEKAKKSSFFSLKLFFLILAIFIIFGGFFASFRFSTLDLEIWPETETIIKEEKICKYCRGVFNNFAKEWNIEW